MVANFELPRVEDLKLTTIEFDSNVPIWLEMILKRTVIFQNFWHIV